MSSRADFFCCACFVVLYCIVLCCVVLCCTFKCSAFLRSIVHGAFVSHLDLHFACIACFPSFLMSGLSDLH